MAKKASPKKTKSTPAPEGITKITVAGFKSISEEQSIEIAPLTILAGANSSGKSSIMQPLLLFKQTLEANYDPGALRIDGPNVKFTSADQFLCHIEKGEHEAEFHFGIEAGTKTITTYFKKYRGKGLDVQQMTYVDEGEEQTLRLGMTHDQIVPNISSLLKYFSNDFQPDGLRSKWVVNRNRCFLEPKFQVVGVKDPEDNSNSLFDSFLTFSLSENIELYIRNVIHLPGLRGNPERTYPVTAVGSMFPGTFENYVASVIAHWQTDKSKIETLSKDLEKLGLTWKVAAKSLNDTQVELQVGRMIHGARGGARDMVSIADVGFGVSQTLPVLVALLAAKPHQLVYLEQPEIHLHPRAQTAMAEVLADAANRGVHVVVETHSSLLLLGVQTLVAEGKLAPDKVKLHWFKRRKGDGATEITTAELDEAGAFGDWPEDFDDVTLEAESKYLDAAESRARTKRRAG
ncbi:MAG: AAA family ATPase [Pyrinomonadaceae bacterium]